MGIKEDNAKDVIRAKAVPNRGLSLPMSCKVWDGIQNIDWTPAPPDGRTDRRMCGGFAGVTTYILLGLLLGLGSGAAEAGPPPTNPYILQTHLSSVTVNWVSPGTNRKG